MKKIIAIAVSLILLQVPCSKAQEDQGQPDMVNLKLSAVSYGDSIVLRWGYEQSSAWRTLNQYGFVLERISLDQNNQVQEDSFQMLTPEPITPWPLDDWEVVVDTGDEFALVAAQALYGKSFELSPAAREVEIMQDKADEAQNRFSFALFAADMSPLAADGLGLRYVDKHIDSNMKYIYRLSSPHPETFFTTDTVQFVINARDVYRPYPPTGLRAIEGDHEIILSWPASDLFTAYFIEKSIDGGRNYQPLNEYPYIQLSRERQRVSRYTYSDSLAENYKPYHYRIAGVTLFGDRSPWSAPMKAMGRDRTPPPAPIITKIENPYGNNVILDWEMYDSPPDLDGFFIGKSANVSGPFRTLNREILPPETRSYEDESIDIHGRNYYVVVSVDTARNVSNSMPAYVVIIDSIPPSMPVGLRGIIDTTGIATLHWPRGTEPDLKGYRVYASNSPYGDLIPVSKGTIQDTVFVDTLSLNTLDKTIYYSIVAVDWNYNNSPYSDRLELLKPDIVPPVAPVIRTYSVENGLVTIDWIPSSSRDVVEHTLYRQVGEKEWDEYASLYADSRTFVDTNITRQQFYTYAIRAVDDAGLQSGFSNQVRIMMYDDGIRDGIGNVGGIFVEDDNAIRITWEYPVLEKCSFILYRSFNGSGLVMHASLESEERSFSDQRILRPGTYEYALRAVYPDGGRSPLSDKIVVVVGTPDE